jgi:hypothetical protein
MIRLFRDRFFDMIDGCHYDDFNYETIKLRDEEYASAIDEFEEHNPIPRIKNSHD